MNAWIPSAILYQVNLRSLAAREPRNAVEAAREEPLDSAPLAYLAANLDVIAGLGVNTLYMMPIYPCGLLDKKGLGSPYSIRDFRAIDPEYGSLDEFRALVRAAHGCGMHIILDITPNHSSRDNPWTAERPDYYVKDAQGTITFDMDWKDTAKLNYQDAGLRDEMRGVFEFWLGVLGEGQGVDGFRLDMAHLINGLDFWNETMLVLRERHADRELLFLAECYGTARNLDLFGRGVNAAYDDDFYKLGEYLYGLDEDLETIVLPSPVAEHNQDFADKLAAFRSGGIAAAVARALLNYEEALGDPAPAGRGVEPAPTFGENPIDRASQCGSGLRAATTQGGGQAGPWLARYTDNHDEGRGTYRFGDGGVQALMQVAFLSGRCLPFLMTGQEFGAVNRPTIHNRFGTCEKGRRIVRGDAFEERGVEFEGNVFARGRDARQAWYSFYRELIRLRLANPALTEGSFTLVDPGEECAPHDCAVIAFDRTLGDTTLRCAVNLGPEARKLANHAAFQGQPLYGQMAGDTLGAFSGLVIRV